MRTSEPLPTARRYAAWRICAAASVLLLAACSAPAVRDGAPAAGSAAPSRLPDDAVPRPEPRSRYGNGPIYEVFGQTYTVLPSSAGYRERGVASWYGKKFHGNLTANREPYDMYAMTAAHKSLPLPTYVRVRNLRNDRSVVVRVNDRGPFVHNRIIDLSYSAALKLDMVRDGTSLVEVEAISFDQLLAEGGATAAAGGSGSGSGDDGTRHIIHVQVGAFGSRENADRRLAALHAAGIRTAFVLEDTVSTPPLYRVRIGPIRDVVAYDYLVDELDKLGIADPYLVAD